jgi:hypothetical protein
VYSWLCYGSGRCETVSYRREGSAAIRLRRPAGSCQLRAYVAPCSVLSDLPSTLITSGTVVHAPTPTSDHPSGPPLVVSELIGQQKADALNRTSRRFFLGLGPSRQSIDGRSVDAVVEPAQFEEVYSEPSAGQEQHDLFVSMISEHYRTTRVEVSP